MDNVTKGNQVKLGRRLRRQFAMTLDCLTRTTDMLDEACNDTFELAYVVKQLQLAAEHVAIANSLVSNFVTEYANARPAQDGEG